jgi:hypothetical protein
MEKTRMFHSFVGAIPIRLGSNDEHPHHNVIHLIRVEECSNSVTIQENDEIVKAPI